MSAASILRARQSTRGSRLRWTRGLRRRLLPPRHVRPRAAARRPRPAFRASVRQGAGDRLERREPGRLRPRSLEVAPRIRMRSTEGTLLPCAREHDTLGGLLRPRRSRCVRCGVSSRFMGRVRVPGCGSVWRFPSRPAGSHISRQRELGGSSRAGRRHPRRRRSVGGGWIPDGEACARETRSRASEFRPRSRAPHAARRSVLVHRGWRLGGYGRERREVESTPRRCVPRQRRDYLPSPPPPGKR